MSWSPPSTERSSPTSCGTWSKRWTSGSRGWRMSRSDFLLWPKKKTSRPFWRKLVRLTLFLRLEGGCTNWPSTGWMWTARGQSLTWRTDSWLSICLQTRSVPLPGRPPAGSASASKPGQSLYLEDRQLAQHLPPDKVCPSTWKTTRWLSICLQTRCVSLPGRPPADSASASRPGVSLYLEDHQLAQHLSPDQGSPSTWKTTRWLSICLQTWWVCLSGRLPDGSASASRPGKSLYLEDWQLAQHLPPDQVSPSTWKTDSWLSICLQTRSVSLPGRPPAGSASASRPGKSLYLEDRQLAQHLPPDQVSPFTWKTASWLSICLQTRQVPLPRRPPAGSAFASRPGKSLYLEDRQLAQHLPPDQVSPSTWLSICLQTR